MIAATIDALVRLLVALVLNHHPAPAATVPAAGAALAGGDLAHGAAPAPALGRVAPPLPSASSLDSSAHHHPGENGGTVPAPAAGPGTDAPGPATRPCTDTPGAVETLQPSGEWWGCPVPFTLDPNGPAGDPGTAEGPA